MLSSGCSRVTARPEDMYPDASPNNNKSLVVAPSLSEPLMPFLGMRASGPTLSSGSNTGISSSSSSSRSSNSSSSTLRFNDSNSIRPTERKRIKSMSAVFEQQQLQQQQLWNIDTFAPAVDWQLVEEDPEALPRLQKPRYKQDEYNPKWVRFSGHLKEGYCDTCGRWLQLKNSAYWYHKQFYHGISSVSGKRFYEPLEQRLSNEGVIEGLCHQCGYFVPICNGKRQKNSLLWYKHAHKCHVYNKPEKFTPATTMTTPTTTTAASSNRSFPL
ncbi:hypothetical protein BDB00DRAFT_614891 [Zychaea mexicana]|uniref:uncharacterized protein n=1 Tax=Zychaea mexicana TaxID=64656 RepID=UPI0022FDF289|nr:uncharacterized protein BDB00DRAFT_614891 [Zychaea mexicana]KAI9489490.1 hypothetical protein BDB00DRAFT_614891 [Zychaea mexicana]